MTLGQKIKKLRNEKNLTQKDLADRLYVTFQTVSKWENDENEPDVSTLRELAKLFDCTIDYLLSEEEEQPQKEDKEELEVVHPVEQVTKTVIVHQKELHVCERCKKDIPEDDLVMEDICIRHALKGRSAEYRKAYYHKECLDIVNQERAAKARRDRAAKASSSKKKCFGWGIAGGVVALTITLLVLLLNPDCRAVIHPAVSVVLSLVAGYGLFSMIYCILSGSYIGDVFVWCAGLSIKFPGIIFSWDLDGLAFLVVMKVFFAVLGFIIGVLALMFAVGLCAALGMVSFPFILIHNNHTDYKDAF